MNLIHATYSFVIHHWAGEALVVSIWLNLKLCGWLVEVTSWIDRNHPGLWAKAGGPGGLK